MPDDPAGTARPGQARFHPPSHVMAAFTDRHLSLAARLLALALACKARKALDGRYYVWRGRRALSQLTGLSLRSVTAARRELLEAGLFLATYPATIETVDGVFDVTPGVPVLELVEHLEAFLPARERARANDRRVVDAATQVDRLAVQRQYIQGQLTIGQCRRQEDAIRREYRRDRAGPGGEGASPKGLTTAERDKLGRRSGGR